MPSPIDAVKTRVVKTGGRYYPQCSTTGLTWVPLNHLGCADMDDAKGVCERHMRVTEGMTYAGEVVWQSDKT